jgi:hypothetical protein
MRVAGWIAVGFILGAVSGAGAAVAVVVALIGQSVLPGG